jgi:hypothetical protein
VRRGGILIATAGLLFVILGSHVVAQDPAGECAAEHEKWSKALVDLRDQLGVYRRVKGESLEPRIMEQLQSSSEPRTTVARIVQSTIRDHERRVAEAEKDVSGVAAREKSAFKDLKVCMTSNRARSNKSDRALFQTALKARQELLKELDRLLAN